MSKIEFDYQNISKQNIELKNHVVYEKWNARVKQDKYI